MQDDNRTRSDPVPERPRSEPEIIPPASAEQRDDASRIWIRSDTGDRSYTYRTYVGLPGQFSIILALMVIGLVAAIVLVVLVGLVLVWIPIVIVLVAAALLSGSVRSYWRRLQHWWRGQR